MTQPEPRVYPLGPPLTEEQVAVTFAMTSRNPDPFDKIAQQVTETRAADFNERWVVGYGHSSVAEHAVIHLAVENHSRLAIDSLESIRLSSYTEKSSRYQVYDNNNFHTPAEFDDIPEVKVVYNEVMNNLFHHYRQALGATMAHLAKTHPQLPDESDRAWNLRRRRIATDSVRSLLPAATHTNVGVTANARTMEHMVTKLMSTPLAETVSLGKSLRDHGRAIAPTLLKYADHNAYLAQRSGDTQPPSHQRTAHVQTSLLRFNPTAVDDLTAALLYRESANYADAQLRVRRMPNSSKHQVIAASLANIRQHDAPPREFETIEYLFESTMDYGALREFRRHRMLTPISQLLTTRNGYHTPQLIAEAHYQVQFDDAMQQVNELHNTVNSHSPLLAQYAVTHAHLQNILWAVNLRQCYPLFRLRTSPLAHAAIQEPMRQALDAIKKTHPTLVLPLTAENN